MMDIKIRSAGTDDVAFLAWLILTAGRAHVKRGIWEVILGESENKCLTFLELLAITETPHLFHHSCYLVAELGSQPVAGLGGYDPRVLGYPALERALVLMDLPGPVRVGAVEFLQDRHDRAGRGFRPLRRPRRRQPGLHGDTPRDEHDDQREGRGKTTKAGHGFSLPETVAGLMIGLVRCYSAHGGAALQ